MNDKIAEIVIKAWTNPEFAKALRDDTKLTLESEGLTFPDTLAKVSLVENSSDTAFFVLPAKPSELASFTADDLKNAVENILSVQLVLPTILD